jgi:hypothetical protein
MGFLEVEVDSDIVFWFIKLIINQKARELWMI